VTAARAGRRAPARIRVWPIPIALALASGVGLISALVGDGPWDALSWLCLAAPLAAIFWSLRGSAGR
jgi:hypothetical protein